MRSGEPTAAPTRPRWRRAVRMAGIAMAVLSAMILLLIGGLHTDRARAELRSQLVSALASSFPGGAQLGAVEGSVLGELVLRRLVIFDRLHRPAISIDELRVNLSLPSLLRHTLKLEHVRAEGVTVLAYQEAEQLNLATLLAPSTGPSTWEVALDRFELRRGAITLTRSHGVAVAIDHVDDLAVAAALTMTRDGALRVQLKGSARWRERGSLATLSGQLRAQAGAVEIDTAEMTLGDLRAALRDVRYAGRSEVTATVDLHAGRGALRQLQPQLAYSPAIDLTLTVAPAFPGLLYLRARGRSEHSDLGASFLLHPTAPRPKLLGLLQLGDLPLAALLGRAAPAAPFALAVPSASLMLALEVGGDGSLDSASGSLRLVADAVAGPFRLPALTIVGAVERRRINAELLAATGGSHLRGRVDAELAADGAIALRTATLSGHLEGSDVPDPLRANLPGAARLAGIIDLALQASGRLAGPQSQLAVTATVAGRALRYGDWSVGKLAIAVQASDLFAGLLDRVAIEASTLAAQGKPFADLALVARGATADRLSVEVAARPRLGARWSAKVGAEVRRDRSAAAIIIALREYRARAAGLDLVGRGGVIELGRAHLAIERVALSGIGGRLSIDARRDAARLEGDLTLVGIDLATLAAAVPQLAGLAGRIELRARGSWGSGATGARLTGTIRGLITGQASSAIDADLELALRPDRLHLELDAHSAEIGALTARIDVVPPRDLLDLAAWQRLPRTAFEHARIEAPHLELSALGRALAIPVADGIAALRVDLTTGIGVVEVTTRRLLIAAVPAAVDLTVSLTLDASSSALLELRATLADQITAIVSSQLTIAALPLQPAAWKGTRDQWQRAHLEVQPFVADAVLAQRLGLGDWRGRAAASFDFDLAAGRLLGHLALDDIRNHPMSHPAALTADFTWADGTAQVSARAALAGAPVLTVQAETALALDQLRTVDWQRLAVRGRATLGPVELPLLLAALDDAEVLPPRVRGGTGVTGSLRGSATFSGPLSAPIFDLDTAVRDVGRGRAKLRELRVQAHYRQGAVRAEITGSQPQGGTVHGVAEVAIADLSTATVAVKAHAFDLLPLAQLVPRALLGVSGTLDADLQVIGLRPASARVAGTLTLRKVRWPLANQLGVLTEGAATLTFTPGQVQAAIDGKVESGKVAMRASAALDGMLPRSAVVDLTITDLAVINTLAPKIDGTLHAEGRLDGTRWKVDARVSKGSIRVPSQQGRELHPVGSPGDLVFVANARTLKQPKRSLAASARSWAGGRVLAPWAEIALTIDPFTVRSPQLTGAVQGKVDLAIANDGLSVDGAIAVSRGNVKLFGRLYQIQRAAVTFDGSIDPAIDIRLSYDFPQLSMLVAVRGRLSNPQLDLSSDPASYTEAQLLGFVLGGAPGASGRDSRDAVSGVAAAVASQTLGGFLTRQLPVRIDVLGYQPQTLTTSASVVAGTWLTEKLLLLLRSRSDPRPLENSAEGELQYWLRRGLLLDGVAGDRGSFSLDLLWNRRW
jgi:TamB, inner membrane protein subunit of TAM complex